MKYRVLIIGLGRIGMGYDLGLDAAKHVYSHCRAFSKHPGFSLAAGVDPDPELRARFTSDYGAPAYADVAAALSAAQTEVVVIAAPTAMHHGLVREVLSRCEPRAILCEKPLACSVEEGQSLLDLCKERNSTLFVNFMRRSDPAVIEVKRRIDSGAIVTPVKCVVWYSKGFLHNGAHFFNLAEYWLGPMRYAAVVDAGRRWEGLDPEPDVRVVFQKGTVVFLSAWEEAFSHYTVEIVSPSGRLRYDRRGEVVQWQPASPDPYFSGYTTLAADAEQIPSGMNRYQWHVADELAASMRGEPFNLCTGAQALQTLASMQEITAHL